MAATYESFLQAVDDGIAGKTAWIPLSLDKLGEHIGITKKIYTLLAGFQGTGKTSIADDLYLLDAYDWLKKNKHKTDTKMQWLYFSMERSSVYKIAKWTANRLLKDHGILIDVKTILNWKTGKSAVDKGLKRILIGYSDYFNELLDSVELLDGPKSPTEIAQITEMKMLNHGSVIKSDNTAIYKLGQKIGEFNTDTYELTSIGQRRYYVTPKIYGRDIKIYQNDEVYIEKDTKLITNNIQDHVGCCINEGSKKDTLDLLSRNNRYARDFFGNHILAVSQMNRSMSDSTRRTKMDVVPEASDIKDTSNLAEDADVILGLINPYSFNIRDYLGYNVNSFVNKAGYNRFRSITLIKNTYGVDGVSVGLHFIGEVGSVTELPKAANMTKNSMSDAASLDKIIKQNYISKKSFSDRINI